MSHSGKASLGARLHESASKLFGIRRKADKPPNPFTPGPGRIPPCLAGRDEQIRVLTEALLNHLSRQAPPPHDVAMVAQRGVGKTALVHWLQIEAGRRGMRVVNLTPRELADARELMLQTLPQADAEAAGTRSEREVTARLGGEAGSLVALVSQTRRSASEGRLSPQAWREGMEQSSKARPCLILGDEAQHFRPEVAGTLFEGVQKMQGRGFPMALVIAGTPDTWEALGKAGASFHDRLGKGQLSLGLLDEAASMQAVGEGINAPGLDIEADGDALRMVHADSQGYPYFLQVWGEALYDNLDWPNDRNLTPSHVKAAWAEVNRIRKHYYSGRWREMADAPGFGPAGLVPVCATVARGVLKSGGEETVVSDAEVDAWVAEGLRIGGAGALEDARRLMRHMGFLVNAGDGLLSAGIPSLMRHALWAAITAERVPSSWGEGLDLEARPPKRSAVSAP